MTSDIWTDGLPPGWTVRDVYEFIQGDHQIKRRVTRSFIDPSGKSRHDVYDLNVWEVAKREAEGKERE